MLIEFTIENYLSIKDSATFSMQTAPYLKRLKDTNTFNTKPINLLKSSVIFGANGSGKTNLFNAFKELKFILLNYERKPIKNLDTLPFRPFKMVSDYEDSFTTFEIVFLLNESIYKYIIKYNHKVIKFEALYLVQENDVVIFERRKMDESYTYLLGDDVEDFQDITRDTSPYLSVLAANNNELAIRIMLWISRDVVFIGSNVNVSTYDNMLKELENKEVKNKLINFMKVADFNIVDIELRKRKQQFPEKYKEVLKILELEEEEHDQFIETIDLFTVYKKYNENNEEDGYSYLDVDGYESRGTQKMIILSLFLLDALDNGKTVLIDEFDNAFHFEISHFLLKLFNSPIYNKNSQFILNTHDLALMDGDILRVDQIWFVEKDKENKSELYSLYDFNDSNKRARSDMSFVKSYLKGQYGAVPIINQSILDYNIFDRGE